VSERGEAREILKEEESENKWRKENQLTENSNANFILLPINFIILGQALTEGERNVSATLSYRFI
jgi:hypothetical protein